MTAKGIKVDFDSNDGIDGTMIGGGDNKSPEEGKRSKTRDSEIRIDIAESSDDGSEDDNNIAGGSEAGESKGIASQDVFINTIVKDICCPITGAAMKQPVLTNRGITSFENAALRAWLDSDWERRRCPISSSVTKTEDLRPNTELSRFIDWVMDNKQAKDPIEDMKD